jgi:hypothetical protein
MTPETPDANDSLVPLILGIQTPLLVVSIILWALRIDSRCRPTMKLWWDDFCITVAVVCNLKLTPTRKPSLTMHVGLQAFSIASYVVTILCLRVGYGHHAHFASTEHLKSFAHFVIIAGPLWDWEVTFIKLSVAFMFLRISRSVSWERTWKWIMYLSIFYLVAAAILVLSLQLTECRPLPYFWNKAIKGRCRTPQEVRNGIVGTQVVFIFSDFQFSLLPLPFVFRLNRSVRERALVAGIMSLGLLASVVGCFKFIGFGHVRTGRDPTWTMVPGKLSSAAEASIGIIASNIPPLKSRGQKLFQLISSNLSGASGSTVSHTGGGATTVVGKEYPMAKHDSVEDQSRSGSTGTLESAKTPRSTPSKKEITLRAEEV